MYNQFTPKSPFLNEGYDMANIHVHPNTIAERIIDSIRAELDFFMANTLYNF